MLARIIPNGSLEQIIYRVDALHALEDSGIRVMNSPRAIERSVDKFYASAILQRAGLATPDTVVCECSEEALAAFRRFGRRGCQAALRIDGIGHGAGDRRRDGLPRLPHDRSGAWRLLRAAHHRPRRQRRAGVRRGRQGARARSSARRPPRGRQWRTNVSRGGLARAIELPPALCAVAIEAARTVGADYAGVDLLPARDGTVYVLELNGIPGWQGLQQATGHRRGRRNRRLCMVKPGFRRRAPPTRLPARGERAKTGQRVTRTALSRHAVRGFPGQRGRRRAALSPSLESVLSARRVLAAVRGDAALDGCEHQPRNRASLRAACACGARRCPRHALCGSA